MKMMNKLLVAGSLMVAASGAMALSTTITYVNNTGAPISVTSNGKQDIVLGAGTTTVDVTKTPTLKNCTGSATSCPIVFSGNKGTAQVNIVASLTEIFALTKIVSCSPSSCVFPNYKVEVNSGSLAVGQVLLGKTVTIS